MKTTHTIHDVDALILEKVILLKTSDSKEEKKKLTAQIKKLEKHFNDCNDKHINGKKYPDRSKPKPVSKEELFKLIEEGFPEDKWKGRTVNLTDPEYYSYNGLDVTGVFTKGSLEE